MTEIKKYNFLLLCIQLNQQLILSKVFKHFLKRFQYQGKGYTPLKPLRRFVLFHKSSGSTLDREIQLSKCNLLHSVKARTIRSS